ncbi:hypothetical protein OAH23_15970 [Verrucomicrobia bacterium]|nr:hypothetical protein [Verrucomicrobiota bacterium]MDB4691907.1 hypothetical protein [Verrucomicrobiota bacterium]
MIGPCLLYPWTSREAPFASGNAVHVGWSCEDDLNSIYLPGDQNQGLLWCGNPNPSFKAPL